MDFALRFSQHREGQVRSQVSRGGGSVPLPAFKDQVARPAAGIQHRALGNGPEKVLG